MVFYCQRNSYISEYKTKVLSSTKCDNDVGCFEVTFEDTIFFPEGGGQPYDTGFIDDIAVLKVLRKQDEAIHHMEADFEVGQEVNQKIDWDRRFDHMQQHTGQHLICAIADKKYGFATTSWNLGEKVSSIELDVGKIKPDQLTSLEEDTNSKIRSALLVTVEEFQSNDPKLEEAKTRGLPKDISGPVRIVSIDDIDDNMCCGTHLKNLSELQSIKILYAEKGKANKTLVYFVAGNRVLRYFGECFSREKELNLLLHSNPSDHTRLVVKCQLDFKYQQKVLQTTLRDLAEKEAAMFKMMQPNAKLYVHHRKDADAFYLNCLISSLNDQELFKFLTAGGDSGDGIMIMDGPSHLIETVSKEVCQILDGKGGGKTKFTAKIRKIQRRQLAEDFIRQSVVS